MTTRVDNGAPTSRVNKHNRKDKMALDRGPGVLAKEQQDNATPETGEIWIPFPDGSFPRSVTFEEIGAADGVHKALRIFVYDKARNVTMSFKAEDGPDGGDFFLGSSGPGPTPSIQKGFDIGFPDSVAQLQGVISALGATWCGLYVGGPTYAGSWTPAMAQAIAPSLSTGFATLYVGANVINGVLQAGPLTAENGYGHGQDAVNQLQNYGLDISNHPVVFFDLEQNTFDSDAAGSINYLEGCIEGARDSGADGGAYSGRTCLQLLMRRVNPVATWLAGWDGQPITEGFDIHQYHGSITVANAGVDLDVALVGGDSNITFAKF